MLPFHCMLDLASLKPQIDRMAREQRDLAREFANRRERAESELRSRGAAWEALAYKVDVSKTSWLVASPLGDAAAVVAAAGRPASYTVVAADGSQILPDRHESFPCFLLNVGSVVLRYGERAAAKLTSRPLFYFDEEDRTIVWDGRRVTAGPEAVAVKRTLVEFEELLRLALESRSTTEEGPVAALSDGTLILWTLEAAPQDFRLETVERVRHVMDGFREAAIPVAGYISYPASADVVNMLRVTLCPEAVSVCSRCPYTRCDRLPCDPVEGVVDRALFGRMLAPGERSQLFASSSKVLSLYGEHAVCFFYVNNGWEVARVEVPRWVADDASMVDLVHAVVLDQARKGGGYPVALREAHELAVVRAADREQFFTLLREALVKNGLKVAFSRKAVSKRRPAV